MVVNELDLVSVPIAPNETDASLLVHADRMLAAPVAAERLQPIAGGMRTLP
jgi:hypothetical protein